MSHLKYLLVISPVLIRNVRVFFLSCACETHTQSQYAERVDVDDVAMAQQLGMLRFDF